MNAATLLLLAAAAASPDPTGPVTFNEHVAPILFANCAPCHRPHGSAPFALLGFEDARKRAKQIAKVTRSRYMPPWLPLAGYGEFAGERRLEDSEIALLQRWAAEGPIEGDPAALPPAPIWNSGWQLGEPDLVVKMPQAYSLPAGGADVYRNFVIPAPAGPARWVEAVEIVPSSPRVVHHARLLVDRTPASRQVDALDAQPGFEGMEAGTAESPDGILVGWTPGKVSLPPVEGIAWRLDSGTDIVLQLHFVPSGKPEQVEVQIGLHCAAKPPALHPVALLLGSRSIDIPAGANDYHITDQYQLPVAVAAYGIYPHAHYLGRAMQVYATLPDESQRWLLRIGDWDFNWQDEYRYVKPVPLPRGSTLHMDYSYDNSPENLRNPSLPPRRVTYGGRTTDEMAELMLQVVPQNDRDRELLLRDLERHKVEKAIAYRKERIASDPRDHRSLAALGATYLHIGRTSEAIPYLEQSLRLAPGDAVVRNNLAFALRAEGRPEEAIAQYRQALEIDPQLGAAHYELGKLLLSRGAARDALSHLDRAVQLEPASAEAHAALAEALARAGRKDEAAREREEASRLDQHPP